MTATRTLSEWDSKRRLAQHGVPVPEERLAGTPAEAAAGAAELGFPVVAKLCGDRIAHKTERGLVRLGLRDVGAVEAAATELFGAAEPGDGDVSVLVGPMVSGIRELIAGVVDDPSFGRCVMLGFGGVLAEALADVQFRLAPLTRADAADMIADLRTQKLLGEFRGEPAVDRDRLVDILIGLSAIAESDATLVAVDLNPLIVAAGMPVPVDALVEVRA